MRLPSVSKAYIALPLLATLLASCCPPDSTPAVPRGLVTLQNRAYEPVVITVTDSLGTTQKTTLPNHGSDWMRVAEGSVTVTTASLKSGAVLSTQTLTASAAKPQHAILGPKTYLKPSSVVLSKSNGQIVTGGRFTCNAKGSATLNQQLNGTIKLYKIACSDPVDTTLTDTITLAFDAASVSNSDNLPEPLKDILAQYSAFKSARSVNTFTIDFDPTHATAGSGSDSEVSWFKFYSGLKPSSPLVPLTMTQAPDGDLEIGLLNPGTQLDTAADDYYVYSQQMTLTSGVDFNNLHFRYRTSQPLPTLSSANLALEFSLDPAAIPFGSPCENWDQVSGFVASFPQTVNYRDLGGGQTEVEFDYALNRLVGPEMLYARVVPLNADNTCAGTPSNWISLWVSTDDPNADLQSTMNANIKNQKATAAQIGAQNPYSAQIVSFVPGLFGPRDGSSYTPYVITRSDNPNGWPVGCAYVPGPPPDEPWYDKAWDDFTSAYDYVAGAFSGMFQGIATGVADTVPFCGDDCHRAINSGMGAALTGLNYRPDQGFFSQLASNGTVWLGESVADSVLAQTGSDIGITYVQLLDQMGTELAGAADQALAGGSLDPNDQYTWGKPDPYYMPYSAMVYVQVSRAPSTGQFGIDDPSFYHFTVGDGGNIWQTQTVAIPRTALQPGESQIIAVVLSPNLQPVPYDQLTEDQDTNDAIQFDNWWINVYQQGNAIMTLGADTTNPNGGNVITQSVTQPYGTYGQVAPASTPCQ